MRDFELLADARNLDGSSLMLQNGRRSDAATPGAPEPTPPPRPRRRRQAEAPAAVPVGWAR